MRKASRAAEATTTGQNSHLGSLAARPMKRPNALHTNRGLVLCPLETMHATSVSTVNRVTGQGSRAEIIATTPATATTNMMISTTLKNADFLVTSGSCQVSSWKVCTPQSTLWCQPCCSVDSQNIAL